MVENLVIFSSLSGAAKTIDLLSNITLHPNKKDHFLTIKGYKLKKAHEYNKSSKVRQKTIPLFGLLTPKIKSKPVDKGANVLVKDGIIYK
jgi:hypothetical protein